MCGLQLLLVIPGPCPHHSIPVEMDESMTPSSLDLALFSPCSRCTEQPAQDNSSGPCVGPDPPMARWGLQQVPPVCFRGPADVRLPRVNERRNDAEEPESLEAPNSLRSDHYSYQQTPVGCPAPQGPGQSLFIDAVFQTLSCSFEKWCHQLSYFAEAIHNTL